MINSTPKEAADFQLKEEGNSSDHHHHEKAKDSTSSSSSLISQWTRLKDPRIVRVSRAFGGKDRHSKVCTIRGLRDRRVRLSVPTAIQLYDLQDRLGLNQPSKVVDWLLNAAKHEIDELPPLPNFPPAGNFPFIYPSSLIPTTSNEANTTSQMISSQNSMWKLKPREVSREIVDVTGDDKANYLQGSNNEGPSSAHVFPNNNLLQRANHLPSFLSLLNTMPLSNYQWESSSDVNSSQFGNDGIFTNQTPLLPSTLSLSTGNSQMLGEATTTQSYFPSQQVTAMEMDHQRQINHHYQMLSSSSTCHQNPLTNSLNNPSFSLDMMTPKFLHSPNSNKGPSNKDQDFSHN